MTTFRSKVACFAVLVALGTAATPVFAQLPKITDLPGLYESANDESQGEWTEYDFKLTSEGETVDYLVKYRFGIVTGRSAPVETTRTLIVDGKPQRTGHVIMNKFFRDKSEIKNLQDQLLKNKEQETWRSLVVKKLEVTAAEDVMVRGTKLACFKIEFEYSGTVGDGLVPVEAVEVIYYNENVKVTKMARFMGTYSLSTINGVKTQKVELTMRGSGKDQ